MSKWDSQFRKAHWPDMFEPSQSMLGIRAMKNVQIESDLNWILIAVNHLVHHILCCAVISVSLGERRDCPYRVLLVVFYRLMISIQFSAIKASLCSNLLPVAQKPASQTYSICLSLGFVLIRPDLACVSGNLENCHFLQNRDALDITPFPWGMLQSFLKFSN